MKKKRTDGISFGAFRELVKVMTGNVAKPTASVGNTGAVRRKTKIGTGSLCRVVGFIPPFKDRQ